MAAVNYVVASLPSSKCVCMHSSWALCNAAPLAPQLLRFDQPVAPVPVGNKAALDVLLSFHPPTWATNYNGSWVGHAALLVTVLSAPAGSRADPAVRASTAVGALSITVLAGGNLTSLDGTSTPCNSSTLLTSGSWGDVVCDGGLYVYSLTALVAAFSPPVNATYVPTAYTLYMSPFRTFSTRSTVTLPVLASSNDTTFAVPLGFPPDSLRFYIPIAALSYVWVAASVPPLSAEVSQDLPRAVLPLIWPLGGLGSCTCGSIAAGAGCGDTPGIPQGLAPAGPVIRTSANLCQTAKSRLYCCSRLSHQCAIRVSLKASRDSCIKCICV
jgi:hypothetical protein